MSFQSDVKATAGLQQAYRSGLDALGHNRRHVSAGDWPRSISGSVDIDSALAIREPNAKRWDYAVGLADGGIVWIEVHPASSTHVADVIGKKQWLMGWLAGTSSPLKRYPRQRFAWAATAGVAFSRHTREGRKLSQAGIEQPTSPVKLLTKENPSTPAAPPPSGS